jgi:hypothetical protein
MAHHITLGHEMTFSSIQKTRGVLSAIVLIIAFAMVLFGVIGLVSDFGADMHSRRSWNIFFSLLVVGGSVVFYRELNGWRLAKEWELRVDSEKIIWIERDKKGERIDGGVLIDSLKALIYVPGDGDSGPSLQLEFSDSTIKGFPSQGVSTEKSLLSFVNYWREHHADIPIKNIDPA